MASTLSVLALGNILIFILAILMLIVFYWYLRVPRNIPPGPIGLPIVGSLPFISRPVYRSYIRLAKKYGPIFHLYLGNRLVIILNDYVAIKEAFIKQAETFSGRVLDSNFFQSDDDRIGLLSGDGESWRQHRRFVMSNLRDNGVGKLSLEPLLLNEIRCFVSELKKSCGIPKAMRDLLFYSLSNNIHLLVTGNRYDYDHPVLRKSNEILLSFVDSGDPIGIHTFLPWTSSIPGLNRIKKHKIRWQGVTELIEVIKQVIKDTKRDEPQYENLIDAYMKVMEDKNQDENEKIFSTNGLLHVSRDLLHAGAETSAKTMLWGMIYLTNHQDVQRKVQKEIDEVIGHEREPSYGDRSKTPYTVAMITEVHRIVSMVPLALPHRTTQDTKVLGYRIPKDTMVFANIYAANNDPKLWGDPHNFRPERFIGADGRLVVPEYFIPFSIGKRACAGEPLARMELYLYFASLLQNFNFVSIDGSKLPLDANEKLIRGPLFDLICVTDRIK